jgi:hypothetical protein
MKLSAVLFLSITLITASCNNEKVSEVEKARQALESKKQELSERKELAQLSAELKSLDSELRKVNGFTDKKVSQGEINAGNVIMRASASVSSDKLGNFNEREQVSILQKQVSLSNSEAILNQSINLGDGSSLLKGKAVKILGYDADHNAYDIQFEHPKHGLMTSNLPTYVFDKTDNDIWYQVRRNNGETGWVFGRFLNEI